LSDLNSCARRLLDFAYDSVQEGLADPSTCLSCFEEADQALTILKKILFKDDTVAGAHLSALGIFDKNFVRIFENFTPDERANLFQNGLELLGLAKQLL
jgi:hypothetical protein